MADTPVAQALSRAAAREDRVLVQVSYEVVKLLSDQLYASPLKAIEELVVNSWDADARTCLVYVPPAAELTTADASLFVAVADNGIGMALPDLRDLWMVGVSRKREGGELTPRKRLKIGKFGIGKLASYAIASRVTYLTRTDSVRGLTVDFSAFTSARDRSGAVTPVTVDLMKFGDPAAAFNAKEIAPVLKKLGLTQKELLSDGKWRTWTIVVLEGLRERSSEIREGRLKWILGTAMPLERDFTLALNGKEVESAKERRTWLVDFPVAEIEPDRLKALRSTGVDWNVVGEGLVSKLFPNGVTGQIRVAEESLYVDSAKSEDLGRSHGFFIRVHNRLINESDPLFGLKPLSYQTFNRFVASINANDLDQYITAPRDDVEQGPAKKVFRDLLQELFSQGRDKYEDVLSRRAAEQKQKREGIRDFVAPRLVELPVADALVGNPDQDWTYLQADKREDALEKLVAELYAETTRKRHYTYRYSSFGKQAPVVRFAPSESVFYLNTDHDLVIEYAEDPRSKHLLEILVTAEALLEPYLYGVEVPTRVIRQILSRRDDLLRALATDELYSVVAIARSLRESGGEKEGLEVALVSAVRALGFATQHIGGAGKADGSASYAAFSNGAKLTLEAKSSAEVPSLSAIDFAGLRSHAEAVDAKGCLLVSVAYPGSERGDSSEASQRARTQRVSCWTTELLARVVEKAEARHINAEEIVNIVTSKFAPGDVASAVEELLAQPRVDQRDLYSAILDTIDRTARLLPGSPRNTGMLALAVAMSDGFADVTEDEIREAVEHLARASQGLLFVRENGDVHFTGDMAEIRRRAAGLTKGDASPRRRGVFRRHPSDDRA